MHHPHLPPHERYSSIYEYFLAHFGCLSPENLLDTLTERLEGSPCVLCETAPGQFPVIVQPAPPTARLLVSLVCEQCATLADLPQRAITTMLASMEG